MAKQCPKAQACGGCAFNGIKYSEQLEIKQKSVEKLIGHFCPVAPIYAMADPFYYRNKVQSVFGFSRTGSIVSGIYRQGTHNLIPVQSCMIEDRNADRILQTIRLLVRRLGLVPYDEDTHRGLLRHVLIRYSQSTDQALVVLVCSAFRFPRKKPLFVN